MRRTLKHFSTWTKPELRKMMQNYKKMVTLARKYPDKYSWARTRKRQRGSVASMADELDTHEKTDGKPIKWEFDYDWIYFWTSQYVHATVLSLDSHAWSPPIKEWQRFEPFKVYMAPYRGKHTAGLAVFNTGVYLHKILLTAFRAIGQPYPDELSKPIERLLKGMSAHDIPTTP